MTHTRTAVDTSLWLLAGLSGCAACELPLAVHPAGRDRRFYSCVRCGCLHPAEPLEQGIITAARERDWMLAQRTGSLQRWSGVNRGRMRRHLRRLVAAAMVAPAGDHAVLYWTAEATLDAHSPWLGLWGPTR